MKFRSTYILIAVAVALVLFTYFYEIRGGKKREEAKEKATKVFDVKDADISWVEIVRPNAEPLRVESVGSGDDKSWKIVKPLETRAEDGAVGSMTWQLMDLSFTQVVQENPGDLAQYGLASPELKVNFGAGQGAEKKEWAIEFGKKLAVGDGAYAKVVGQTRVLLVTQTARSTFDKQAIDLRDKKVVAFKDDKLTAIEISTPEFSIKLEKAGENWKITAPIKADADTNKVAGMLEDMHSLEAKEFLPSVMAASLGLGTPEMTLTLVTGADQRARQTVKFYHGKDPETAYARPEGDAWIYKIAPDLLQNLPRPAAELRQKKVLPFERWDIEQIRLKPDGKPDMLLAKNDAGDWEFIEPKGVKEKIVGSQVYDMLDAVSNLEAVEFVDNPPSEKQLGLKAVIVLYKAKTDQTGKKTGVMEFATLYLGKDVEGGKRYAKGVGSQIFLIEIGLKIPQETKDLTAVTPPPEAPPGGIPGMPGMPGMPPAGRPETDEQE